MEFDKLIVADNSPYPVVRVQRENPRFAAQLTEAFGGGDGEFGTISDYVYQGIVFAKDHPEYARVFMELAKVEMHHLAMVGSMIEMLGGKLIYGHYSCNEPVYWNGADANYSRRLSDALISDLGGEQRAYAAYVSLARQSGDRYIFAVLTRIALDEMIHASLLKSMINKLRQQQTAE